MNRNLIEKMCCPEDGADLILHELEVNADDVREGVLECSRCGDGWTVVQGIPRFVSASSPDLQFDLSLVESNRRSLEKIKPGLAVRIDRKLRAMAGQTGGAENEWNSDEMDFWDKDYKNRFHYDLMNKTTFNRILPRRQFLIDPLFGEKIHNVIEIGCGTCGTIYNIPEFLKGKNYIGTDLSFNALKTGRKFVSGDFVMCEAEKLPFKDGAFDLLLSFGVLHHLEQRQQVLTHLMAKVRDGGYLGFAEKLKSKLYSRRSRLLGMIKNRLTPNTYRPEDHMEFIDDDKALEICKEHGRIISKRYQYSAIRILLVRFFLDKMGLNYRKLAGWIMRLDYFFIDRFGFLSELFRATALVLLVKIVDPRSEKP